MWQMVGGCHPLMGYNFGAKNYKRMRKLIKTGVFVTTAIELCVMANFGIFAPGLIGIFADSDEVIQIGTVTLRSFMLMLPFVGSTSIVRNTFNAMGKPMFVSTLQLSDSLYYIFRFC